jgi:hypothetical protein
MVIGAAPAVDAWAQFV